MPTFDRQDKFSPDKAFSRVVWGERSKVLETELSEMQKILQHQTLALGEAILSNGFVDELPNITYENDELTIDPCAFVIDGFVYRVQSPLVLSQVQPESTVYIEVSEAEVSYQDTIRKDGNYTDGGEDLPDNGILDPDFGVETTRRVQWQIRLVTDDSDESKRYLPVCTVHGENAGVWEYEDLRQLCSLKSTYNKSIHVISYRPATVSGEEYPTGITALSVSNGVADGWPTELGVVHTIKLHDYRMCQMFVGSSNAGPHNGRTYVRSWRIDNGWSSWRRLWDDQEMGPGSGLDADLLDGIQAERFIYGDNARGTVHYAGDLNNITKSGFYYAFTGHSNGPSGANGFLIHHQMSTGNNFAAQTFIDYNNDRFYFRRKIDGAWQGWKKIWNESNGGAGSGLDADLLDGQHASAFWTKSELGSDRTRKITISTSNPSGGANGDIWFVV